MMNPARKLAILMHRSSAQGPAGHIPHPFTPLLRANGLQPLRVITPERGEVVKVLRIKVGREVASLPTQMVYCPI